KLDQLADGSGFEWMGRRRCREMVVMALTALHLLRLQGWTISDADIQAGMAATQWRGRMQWMDWQGHRLLIDGAHNPAGAAALRHYVDGCDRMPAPITWVMGMIGTKDHADVFRALLRAGDRLYLVPVPEHSPVDLEKLAALAVENGAEPELIHLHSDLWTALEAAFLSRSAPDAVGTTSEGTAPSVVLCGSLYLIGHFLKRCSRFGDQPPSSEP
ncbi:MAG: hypothetical protein D6742_15940, partial [Cyanobacteria bacterium J069]